MKTLIYISLLLVLTSCFLFKNDCGLRNPKTNNFRILKNNKFKLDTSILKINGVYIDKFIGSIDGSYTYQFCRFFENGRFFESERIDSIPSTAQLNETNCGSFGHYLIHEDTVIVDYFNEYIGYRLLYYKFDEDNLIYIGSKKRSSDLTFSQNSSNGRLFTFQKANLVSKSDW